MIWRPVIWHLVLLALATMAAADVPAQTAFDPFGEAGIDPRPSAVLPLDAPFRDAEGRWTSLRRVAAGKPMLLVPVLHRCPNFCGVTLAGVAQAIEAQSLKPGRDFAVVAFGIDPREGPEAARDDLGRMSLHGDGIHALTGTRAAIRSVTGAIGYRYAWDARMGQYAHAAATAVIAPDGRLTTWIYGLTPRPAAIAEAVSAARAHRTVTVGEAFLLLCYHYDPATGTYTPAVEKILRLAGGATITGLAALLFVLRRRAA